MKASKYNIYFNRNGKNYIYNTLACSILSCDVATLNALTSNQIDLLDKQTCMMLKKNGCVVSASLDETSVFKMHYNSVQYCSNPEELRLVILPTYQCNLRCTYCFEEDCKNLSIKMDRDKVCQIAAFVISEINLPQRNYKRVSVTLFGGEPFLYRDVCLDILEQISDICKEYRLELKASAITNATLIDTDLIERLIKPYKIRLQITLDGDKCHHDKKRIYANGAGTYECIENVIELLSKHACSHLIDMRLNVDKDNLDCIEPVFKKFHSKTNYMYVGLLRPTGHNGCNSDQCIDDNDYLIKVRPTIIKSIKKYKAANRYVPFGKQRPCALVRNGCFIIDPLLDVYKCDNLIGQPEHSIGKIKNGGISYTPQYYSQVCWSPFDNDKCLSCKLLPACGKSCAFKCFLANEDFHKPFCSMTESQLIQRINAYLDEQLIDI